MYKTKEIKKQINNLFGFFGKFFSRSHAAAPFIIPGTAPRGSSGTLFWLDLLNYWSYSKSQNVKMEALDLLFLIYIKLFSLKSKLQKLQCEKAISDEYPAGVLKNVPHQLEIRPKIIFFLFWSVLIVIEWDKIHSHEKNFFDPVLPCPI